MNMYMFLCLYRLLNPVLSRLDKSKAKELKKKLLAEQFDPVEVSLFTRVGNLNMFCSYTTNIPLDLNWWLCANVKQYKIREREKSF